MKQIFKRIVPAFLWRIGSNIYWSWHNRGRHFLARLLSPRWSISRHTLLNLRNQHKGQRCFIIGNGPSLRQTNLALLKDEVTFGLNRISYPGIQDNLPGIGQRPDIGTKL
jgi:hypothetical protein